MADVVDTKVLYQDQRRYIVRLTNVSDGTGESDVVKIDVSTLTNSLGATCTYLAIEEIEWSIQGFTSVRLEFDATTDDECQVLSGNGYKDYRSFGGNVDPKSTGTTGDILLTTAGTTSGNTYDIVISARKK